MEAQLRRLLQRGGPLEQRLRRAGHQLLQRRQRAARARGVQQRRPRRLLASHEPQLGPLVEHRRQVGAIAAPRRAEQVLDEQLEVVAREPPLQHAQPAPSRRRALPCGGSSSAPLDRRGGAARGVEPPPREEAAREATDRERRGQLATEVFARHSAAANLIDAQRHEAVRLEVPEEQEDAPVALQLEDRRRLPPLEREPPPRRPRAHPPPSALHHQRRGRAPPQLRADGRRSHHPHHLHRARDHRQRAHAPAEAADERRHGPPPAAPPLVRLHAARGAAEREEAAARRQAALRLLEERDARANLGLLRVQPRQDLIAKQHHRRAERRVASIALHADAARLQHDGGALAQALGHLPDRIKVLRPLPRDCRLVRSG
mmetsp:Transcript_40832/g.101483  ORF Transcript_40832/g.101483 Transcript_40832/m.101483 type:complete len:374 (-) Transcript_40832:189-1310(-)